MMNDDTTNGANSAANTRANPWAGQTEPWTPAELQRIAVGLLGTVVDWPDKLARRLEVPAEQVQAWASGAAQVPADSRRQILAMLELAQGGRDRWIIGSGLPDPVTGRMRRYVIHTYTPRFVARLVEVDPDTDQPEDFEEPVTPGGAYAADDSLEITEIQWIDRPPDAVTQAAAMEAAADAAMAHEEAEADDDDPEDLAADLLLEKLEALGRGMAGLPKEAFMELLDMPPDRIRDVQIVKTDEHEGKIFLGLEFSMAPKGGDQ